MAVGSLGCRASLDLVGYRLVEAAGAPPTGKRPDSGEEPRLEDRMPHPVLKA
jgi:hypothetical protein